MRRPASWSGSGADVGRCGGRDCGGVRLSLLHASPDRAFPAPSTQNASDNIANLLSTLIKAGVVSSSSTPDVSAQQPGGAEDSLLP